MSSEAEIARTVLMYFVLPLWLVMGFADWLSRRGARIETSGGGPKNDGRFELSQTAASQGQRGHDR